MPDSSSPSATFMPVPTDASSVSEGASPVASDFFSF